MKGNLLFDGAIKLQKLEHTLDDTPVESSDINKGTTQEIRIGANQKVQVAEAEWKRYRVRSLGFLASCWVVVRRKGSS